MRHLPILLLLLAACAGKPEPVAKLSETQKLTQTVKSGVLTTFDGATVDLAAYEGKVVMLDFWETWCTPCIRSFPGMARAVTEFPDDFAVIAISPGFSDTEDDIISFIASNPYPFTWALGAELATELGVQGIPYKVFLDREGNVLTIEMGSRGPDRDYEKIVELIRADHP